MTHILLVEDDKWMADCYQSWLKAAGHTVMHAPDAQAALGAIDTKQPDAILLDLFLPHANAVQLLHAIRSSTDLTGVPVVLCSSSLPDDVPDLSAYGVKRVIAKSELTPQTLPALLAEVQHAAV